MSYNPFAMRPLSGFWRGLELFVAVNTARYQGIVWHRRLGFIVDRNEGRTGIHALRFVLYSESEDP